MHIHLLATYSSSRLAWGGTDVTTQSLDVKVLFGNLSLVSAPAFFLSRTEVLQMEGYSPGYPVNVSENGDFN